MWSNCFPPCKGLLHPKICPSFLPKMYRIKTGKKIKGGTPTSIVTAIQRPVELNQTSVTRASNGHQEPSGTRTTAALGQAALLAWRASQAVKILVQFSYKCQHLHFVHCQIINISSPPTWYASDGSSGSKGVLTICLFWTAVSEGWPASGEGTATYPATSPSWENGHLRASESAGDGKEREKRSTMATIHKEIKLKWRPLGSSTDGTRRALSPLGFIQTLPRLRGTPLAQHSCFRLFSRLNPPNQTSCNVSVLN